MSKNNKSFSGRCNIHKYFLLQAEHVAEQAWGKPRLKKREEMHLEGSIPETVGLGNQAN